ncbi:MAG TPA: biotin/lipoyl-binding protein [Clostridium sp.]|jgi:biotin carboxyl carrier protein|nr:acetyl-CoA carboxylase biotin carboxyl carrier protein subunit [Clostridium sp. Bc-iso-3]HHV28873.1 biotin/lipoyl-binding protein [Clostridium sp.]
MKKFLIKVNGNQYEVEVEEVRDGASAPQVTFSAPAPAASAPAPAPAPAPKAAAPKKDTAVPAGAVIIKAPMPGTILNIHVNQGDTVKKGQVLLILEAMKMENEILAPNDGTVASVNVSKGSSVNVGEVLLSLN